MQKLKEGDRVRIVERAPSTTDAKTGLYYSYYGNLSGTIFKLYGSGTEAQAAVDIDLDSLPQDVARRHLDTRDQMRATLTGEARRLSAPGSEHELRLRYVVLVALSDLTRKRTERSTDYTDFHREKAKAF